MKYLLCLSFLILIVVAFSSCDDQMKGVMEPVVEEIMEETPAEPEMPAEIPTDIDYANLPLIESGELEPGIYRMNVTNFHSGSGGFNGIYTDYAETVEEKVRIRVLFNPSPWALTTDNKPVVRGLGLHIDAGVVEITERLDTKTEIEGRIEFTYHEFSGILINNLTFPDKPIEYEENATE